MSDDWSQFGLKIVEGWQRRVRITMLGFGLFLIIIGVFWFARDMGWIPNVPVWPIGLIALGVWIAISALKPR